MTFLGHALPGVVVGLSLVFLTLAVLPAAYQTLAVLAFAYAVLFLPKAIGSSRSAIAQCRRVWNPPREASAGARFVPGAR